MGRYKSVEIEGLFFENFREMFESALMSAINDSNLTAKEITKKLSPKLDGMISEYEDFISTFYLANHKFNLNGFLKTHFKSQRFIATQNKDSFISFFLYINGCSIAYEKIIQQIRRKRIDSTLKMNVALYGLVVRRAQEIGDLLLSGYVDGAMIIWRSLYENAVILLILALENDPALADKFYSHSLRNSQKKVVSYNKHHKELKFKPLPKSTANNLQTSIQNVEKQYGKDFLDTEFGWADDLFPGKQKANFRLLEEKGEMSRYRPYYLWCCEQLHSNFNGLKNFSIGNKVILPWILDKDVDLEGFVDPMQFTISVLHDINDYILYEFSAKHEYDVNVMLLKKIFAQHQSHYKTKR